MTKRNWTGFNPTLIGTLAAVALGGFAVPTARADHEDYPKPRVKIDFESLKGELRWSRGEWQLRIKYDVEIEKYERGDRFELVLYVSEHGEVVRDDEGKPIEWVVPLDRPSEIDDDELEFESRITVYRPGDSIRYPKKLRINGIVYQDGYELPLKRKIKSIKYKRSKDRKYRIEPAPVGYSTGSVGAYRPYYGSGVYFGYSRSNCYRPGYAYRRHYRFGCRY